MPKVFSAASKAARIAARSQTSASTASALPPDFSIAPSRRRDGRPAAPPARPPRRFPPKLRRNARRARSSAGHQRHLAGKIEDFCCGHGTPGIPRECPLRSRRIAGINAPIKRDGRGLEKLWERTHDGLSGHAAVDGEPRTARRAAADHGRSRLGPRDRGHHPARSREEGPGAAVREHQGLCGRPLHQAIRQRARRPVAPGAGAWHVARCQQSRTGPARDEEEPRGDSPGRRRQRTGEGRHHPRRRHRPDRVSGSEMALPRRRPLHPHLLRHRDQGPGYRRHECRSLSRHDRPQGHRRRSFSSKAASTGARISSNGPRAASQCRSLA